jgi:hypothetical protein
MSSSCNLELFQTQILHIEIIVKAQTYYKSLNLNPNAT